MNAFMGLLDLLAVREAWRFHLADDLRSSDSHCTHARFHSVQIRSDSMSQGHVWPCPGLHTTL